MLNQKGLPLLRALKILQSTLLLRMSNGKDVEDNDFEPQDPKCIPLCNWRIRRKRVLQVLRAIDSSKSANGISPEFWKHTADVVHDAVTSLFKRIVKGC